MTLIGDMNIPGVSPGKLIPKEDITLERLEIDSWALAREIMKFSNKSGHDLSMDIVWAVNHISIAYERGFDDGCDPKKRKAILDAREKDAENALEKHKSRNKDLAFLRAIQKTNR